MIYSELWAIFMSSDFVCILNKRDKSMGENYILTGLGPPVSFPQGVGDYQSVEGNGVSSILRRSFFPNLALLSPDWAACLLIQQQLLVLLKALIDLLSSSAVWLYCVACCCRFSFKLIVIYSLTAVIVTRLTDNDFASNCFEYLCLE